MKKLSNKQVKNIFYEEGDSDYFKEKYDIDIRAVKNIKMQLTYQNITLKLENPGQIVKYGLSPLDVDYIYDSEESYVNLSEKYGIHLETVRNIKKGITRSYEEWF